MFTIQSTKIEASDAVRWGFTKLASIDNPKAVKGFKYHFLNAILYMAPSDTAGVGNLCVHSGNCVNVCIGSWSGQAGIRKDNEDNPATLARKARARAYMRERPLFIQYIIKDVNRLRAIAKRKCLKLCYRFNGSTDVPMPPELLATFPDVTFIDYTKNPNRMAAYLAGKYPANYHLTFSRDTHNERLAERFLEHGGNVSVVSSIPMPETWHGFPVISGDNHDIRTPEMDGRGKVIWLTPKGGKAKADSSGFVLRVAA
jgi:hypothetical protein